MKEPEDSRLRPATASQGGQRTEVSVLPKPPTYRIVAKAPIFVHGISLTPDVAVYAMPPGPIKRRLIKWLLGWDVSYLRAGERR